MFECVLNTPLLLILKYSAEIMKRIPKVQPQNIKKQTNRKFQSKIIHAHVQVYLGYSLRNSLFAEIVTSFKYFRKKLNHEYLTEFENSTAHCRI